MGSFAIFAFLAIATFSVHLHWGSFALHCVALLLMWRCGSLSSVLAAEEQSGIPALIGDGPFARHHCAKCAIWQPLRTKHCREIGRCVATFDHYCFFVGAAIGERNHRVFVFMLIVAAACVSWDVCVLAQSMWTYPKLQCAFYVSVFSLSIFPLILVASLALYHLFLVLSAQTTWEHLARENITYLQPVPDGVNPFSRGLLTNLAEFFSRNSGCVQPITWTPTWQPGDPQPTCLVFQNSYYSCF